MQKELKLLSIIGLLVFSSLSHAAGKIFLTGAEVTSASTAYIYVGTSVPLPESNLGKGYVLHLWADYQTYSYAAGVTEIDVSIDSVSASMGYHDYGEDNWWSARLGVVQSDTRLSVNDPTNESVGSETNIRLQLEGEKRLSTDYKIIANFDYVLGRNSYWIRGRFLSRNDDSYDGLELIHQGDDSYSAYQLGWVLTEIAINKDWGLGMKAGFRYDENDAAVYAGIELSTSY